MIKKFLFFVVFLALFVSCRNAKSTIEYHGEVLQGRSEAAQYANQPAVVYKTTHDYSMLVPVIMDAARTKIISYPAPTDVCSEGKLATPTELSGGYLLDNRGINENVVFLNYTYEAYSKLSEAPALSEMMSRIVDKYPLSELIYCSSRTRFVNEVTELNALIDAGFPHCTKIRLVPMQIHEPRK